MESLKFIYGDETMIRSHCNDPTTVVIHNNSYYVMGRKIAEPTDKSVFFIRRLDILKILARYLDRESLTSAIEEVMNLEVFYEQSLNKFTGKTFEVTPNEESVYVDLNRSLICLAEEADNYDPSSYENYKIRSGIELAAEVLKQCPYVSGKELKKSESSSDITYCEKCEKYNHDCGRCNIDYKSRKSDDFCSDAVRRRDDGQL